MSESTSFLGLNINATLNWKDHVEFIGKKIRSGVYAIGCLRDKVSKEVLRMVYFAHVYSHIRNNIIFWGHSSEMQRVFILQKRALRTIVRKSPRESCRPLFQELNVLTVPGVYIYEAVTFVKKHLELFSKNCDVHNYETRSRADLRVLKHTSSLFSKSPQYRLGMLYNKLPHDIKNEENLDTFKAKVLGLLLKLNCYAVSEFL